METTKRNKTYIGVLPAAGIASRLSPSRYLKELLPVTYLVDDETGTARPVPIISLSLRALREAGVKRCIVTISDRKPELMRYLGDGSDFQLQLAYVQQTNPSGLSAAVQMACDWVGDCHTCLLLPDTIIHPYDAMNRLREVMDSDDFDLVLGVFPTLVPEQLGPVRFDSDGRIYEVLDKPSVTDIKNTWAMAVWSPAFSQLLRHSVTNGSGDQVLGEVFNSAVRCGLKVKAVWFPQGSFVDIGTVTGLSQMVELSKQWNFPGRPLSSAAVAAGR